MIICEQNVKLNLKNIFLKSVFPEFLTFIFLLYIYIFVFWNRKISREEGGWGMNEMGEGSLDVQTSSYNINES